MGARLTATSDPSENGNRPSRLRFVLTTHAVAALAERAIDIAWLERVLLQPERTEADPDDPTLRHALGRIAERDGRVLRVIYNHTAVPWRIVTAYFDRTQRRKL